MHALQTGGEIDLRKGSATGSLSVRYNKQGSSFGGVENAMSTFLLHASVNWDFLPVLFGEVGMQWEKNELHLLKDQYLPYAGVGARWTIFSVHQLNFFVAGGRVFPTYTIPISYFGMQEGAYNGMYISQYYQFSYSQQLLFQESVVHLRNLNETKRYTTNVVLKLSFALSTHLSIAVAYSNSLSTEAGFFGASKVDTGQSVGLTIAI
jgi:hypothetical protein